MEMAKNVELWWALVWKLSKGVFQKHASTLDVVMVTRVGEGGWKIIFFVLKISSFKLSEKVKSVAQGALDIWGNAPGVGGGGAQCAPPWLG